MATQVSGETPINAHQQKPNSQVSVNIVSYLKSTLQVASLGTRSCDSFQFGCQEPASETVKPVSVSSVDRPENWIKKIASKLIPKFKHKKFRSLTN